MSTGVPSAGLFSVIISGRRAVLVTALAVTPRNCTSGMQRVHHRQTILFYIVLVFAAVAATINPVTTNGYLLLYDVLTHRSFAVIYVVVPKHTVLFVGKKNLLLNAISPREKLYMPLKTSPLGLTLCALSGI